MIVDGATPRVSEPEVRLKPPDMGEDDYFALLGMDQHKEPDFGGSDPFRSENTGSGQPFFFEVPGPSSPMFGSPPSLFRAAAPAQSPFELRTPPSREPLSHPE